MILPNTVQIGPTAYEVVLSELDQPNERLVLLGEIVYHFGKIYLNEKQTPLSIHLTLMHEIVHGLLYQIGKNKLNADEDFVTAMGMALYQLIKDNDWSWLHGESQNDKGRSVLLSPEK